MMYLNRTLPQYELIVSVSSLEHPGLGRYGDSINPWSDIIAVARAWCASSDDAKFIQEVRLFIFTFHCD